MTITFETERTLLRPFTLADAAVFVGINNDPDVNKYLPTDERNVTEEEVINILKNSTLKDYEKYGFGRHVIVLKEINEAIGFTGLKYLPELDEVDVGYRIAKKHWGKGIVVEATKPIMEYGFNELKLKKIIALAYPENKASRRVMDKLEMSHEKNIILEGEEFVYYSKNNPNYIS